MREQGAASVLIELSVFGPGDSACNNLPDAHAMALTNSIASIKPFLSVSRRLKRAVDSCWYAARGG